MEWWQRLFDSPIYFELYEAEDTRKAVREVDALLRLLDLHPPARILDVPCGYARHAIELARRGFTVTGVDASAVQIARGREKAAAAGVAVDLRELDARRLEFEGEFDLAINMFLSFGYFETDAEHLAMLTGIARALRPGGRLLMEFWNREYEIRYFDRYQVDRTGEVVEVEEWEFDHLRGRLNWTNTAFFPDGRRQSWWHSIRAYTVVEMRQLFEQAGLGLEAVYGGLGGEPYSIESEAAVFVARRL
ncbi:MAG: class I SAM-dependent methyltransferase [Armatimonadota bacterium]|nr:class I SAM-dependent methyltransferase [Armatimonadota bacterium]MDR7452412.1 class I SAM-dependent methyltransferase [Armatimonadota bacterium]MDR7468097.1 class I SAM-dependent methyltransferase [Armatimonadota bacterium]MDR7494667.1 class I SAM-dependent methyltransferase [Armatimonadota bacterium]MDR7500200.1 class I SAM-dependent methyltransferase [Armatimonadota bacterium]